MSSAVPHPEKCSKCLETLNFLSADITQVQILGTSDFGVIDVQTGKVYISIPTSEKLWFETCLVPSIKGYLYNSGHCW